MKLIKTALAGLILAFAIALPAVANAADETVNASFSLKPQKGQFLKKGFTPADWAVETAVTATGAQILPSKVIDISFPKGQVTFNPGNLPVCPDDQVGPPPTAISSPVPAIVSRCPDSVLGNGTAKFALGQNNLNPNAILDGQIVAFNGGLKGGRPLVKVYAYSYDTQVAIYTEAALQQDGSLVFNVPQLTSDSSVTSLNLSIPSKNITLNNIGPGDETVLLPKGVKADYVQAQCSNGQWPWKVDFTFGTRDTANTPTSPDSFSSDSGTENCVGTAGGGPKVGKVQIQGPKSVKRNRATTYKVQIKNTGSSTAKGVRLRISGRGIRVNTSGGNIKAGKTRTVRVKVRFSKPGNIKASFRVTSKNAGSKTVRRTVRVR